MKMTICMPSFNRPQAAKKSVVKLLKLVNDHNVNVQVIDNGSDSDYAGEFSKDEDIQHAIAVGSLSIVRNPYNIGMGANFMRCFEVADGDWLWMVADDDDIRVDAIKAIFNAIEASSDECGLIVFGSESPRDPRTTIYLKGIEEFIDFNHASADVFNRFIFLTNAVYNLKQFRPLLSFGYQYINTFIPHFMMQIAYMQQGKVCVAIQKRIVDYVVPEIGYSYSMVAGLGVGAPKHALIKTDAVHYRKFLSLFFPHNDYKVIIDLHYICKWKSSPYVCRYLARTYLFYVKDARSSLQLISLRFFVSLLLFPRLFERTVELLSRASPRIWKHVCEIKLRYRSPILIK